MNDLIAFINARLDEEEAVAREAASALPGDEGYGWTAVHRYLKTHPASGESFVVDTSSELVAQAASARSYDRAVADHIARHDPARALREVERDRAVLKLHKPNSRVIDQWTRCYHCNDDNGDYRPYPCDDVLLLAAKWDEHPEYRQALKP